MQPSEKVWLIFETLEYGTNWLIQVSFQSRRQLLWRMGSYHGKHFLFRPTCELCFLTLSICYTWLIKRIAPLALVYQYNQSHNFLKNVNFFRLPCFFFVACFRLFSNLIPITGILLFLKLEISVLPDLLPIFKKPPFTHSVSAYAKLYVVIEKK